MRNEDIQTKQKINEKKREYMKRNRSTSDLEVKHKNNEYMKEYRKKKRNESNNQLIENLITEFHDIVSHGPMYICTCCDQLWYKHSVTKVDNRKTANPNIIKYLLNKTSVDNASE